MEEQPAVDPQQDMQRKARQQVPGPVAAGHSSDAPGPVNIWSGRRVGPRGPKEQRVRQGSAYRCNPSTDTGRTRGSEGEVNHFCLFFAKGMCYQGYLCTYLHRLPICADNEAYARSTSQDIFGREKLPDHLDNRKGAGSYERDMTTLYVHYGGAGHYATPQLRHLLLENFGVFGPIRSIYIVPAKTIAFVKFHWRVSAEFAKEAMDSQPLTGSSMREVLSVRWANDDPNPVAVIGRKRDALDAAEEAAMAAWEALPSEEKRARLALAQAARARKVSAVADSLPPALLDVGEHERLGYDGRAGFDVWRGKPGAEEDAEAAVSAAAAAAGGGEDVAHAATGGEASAAAALPQGADEQQSGEQQSSSYDAQWAAYYAANPHAYAEAWQQYQALPQQLNPAAASTIVGSSKWYEGWKQRQLPDRVADSAAGIEQTAGAVQAVCQAGHDDTQTGGSIRTAGTDGLGLLAGYGSGSEAEEGV